MQDRINTSIKKLEDALIAEDIGVAEQCISQLVLTYKNKSISPILLLLNDNYVYDELMYSLIHAAESFNDKDYVDGFLQCVCELIEKSPEWASVVIMRTLNSDTTRSELAKQISKKNYSIKSSVEWLLNEINQESPEFLAKTVAVLTACRV